MNKDKFARLRELLNCEDITILMEQLPDDVYINNPDMSLDRLALVIQAHTQKNVREIREAISHVSPRLVWKRTRRDSLGWWEYCAKSDNYVFTIYGVEENPPQCTPIYGKKKKRVPVEYEEKEVETIIGWDCGGDQDADKE